MNGGDKIPGPLDHDAANEAGAETALRILVKSLKALEDSIRVQRQAHEQELRTILASRVEELVADAHMKNVLEDVKRYLGGDVKTE